MKRAIFIDLDGTLLPLDESLFLKEYMDKIALFMTKYGYDGNKIVEYIWKGTKAMYFNDGSKTNEELFFEVFEKENGSCTKEKDLFMKFYEEEFPSLKNTVTVNEDAKKFVAWCHKNFDYVILSTNPLFPQIATYERMKWLGLSPCDFDLVTTYENSCYCKPNPMYFIDLLHKFNLSGEEVIVVGNNDIEDYDCSLKAGIECIIVDDSRITSNKVNIKKHCPFSKLIEEIEKSI
ncbi:MAG: HAD family hydrolase [Bacilli bacterium]